MTHPLAVLPFGLYLLVIAVVPLFLGHFWEKNRNKFLVAMAASLPAAIYLLNTHRGHLLVDSLKEYVAFIFLLAPFFILGGEIYRKGPPPGPPVVNAGFRA